MSTLNYLARKPSPEKMRRGAKLVEALSDQFPWYEDAEMALKVHPNWRTDYRDYSAIIHVARKIIKQPYVLVTEGEGLVGGGRSGRWGHIENRGQGDLSLALEKTVEMIYQSEQREGISDEEISDWLKDAKQKMTTQGGSPDFSIIESAYEREIIPRIPRSRDEIRRRLTLKLLEYYRRKTSV